MSVLVNGLKISAFGGIRAPLELDLTAPLTLIYAPNGTGKTSIIESVDWLYGGATREQRCRLAGEAEPTEVAISALVGSKVLSVARRLRNDKITRLSNGVQVGEAEFLQSLAPECDVSDLASQSQVAKLKAFLSSNHVLGVDALKRLIDGTNADDRADAMADLAGTRAQRNAQKVIELYRRRLAERRSKLESKLSKQLEIQSTLLDVSNDREDADALVVEAARILAPEDHTPPTLDRLTVSANAELDGTTHRLSCLAELRSILASSVSGNEVDFDLEITELESAIRELNALSEEDAATYRHADVANGRRLENARQLDEIADALLELHAICEPEETVSGAFHIADRVLLQFSTESAASDVLDELALARSKIDDQLHVLAELTQRSAEIEAALSAQISADQLRTHISHKQAALADQQAARKALSNYKSEAVRAASVAHQHEPHATECPACRHDWGSPSSIESALARSLLELPQAESLLVQAEDQARADIERLEGSLSSQQELRRELARCQEAIEELRPRLARAQELSSRAGFPNVEKITQEHLSDLRRQLRIAEKAADVRDALRGRPLPLIHSGSMTPGSAAEFYTRASMETRQAYRDARAQLDTLSMTIDIRDKEISELTRKRGEAMAAREAFENRRLRATYLRQQLGLTQDSELYLDEIELSLATRQRSLEVATGLLRTAGDIKSKSFLTEEADRARVIADAIAHDIDTISNELERVQRIYSAIEKQADAQRSRLIKAVGPSVSQLFQRMQVNRVFEGVTMNSSFELHGMLGEFSLRPELFSTGQRQDLALAFFLVRAYAMGGSFFLDEPLAHLDDVNRVAVLDTLRAFVLSEGEKGPRTRLVLTTASWTTTRHVLQKFMKVQGDRRLLRAYQLTGNVSSMVDKVDLTTSH